MIYLCDIPGIAVVSLSLVDGKGHQVPLLQGASPCSHGYEEIDSQTDLKSCIATQTFDLKPDSKKPGTIMLLSSDKQVWTNSLDPEQTANKV